MGFVRCFLEISTSYRRGFSLVTGGLCLGLPQAGGKTTRFFARHHDDQRVS